MKRLIVLIIAAMMIMTQVCAAAPAEGEAAEPGTAALEGAESAAVEEDVEGEEESEEEDGLGAGLVEEYLTGPELDHLTIGNPNPLGGMFFTEMWGNVTSDRDIRDLLFQYDLINWNNGQGAFETDPAIVTGIAVVEDDATGNRTYTLQLQEDLYYSDGTQVTAYDYAFSFLLTTSPLIAELGGTPAIKRQIVGYQDYVDGTVPYLAGVRVMGDYTIAITVSGDYLPFFYELALIACQPYPIHILAPGVQVVDDGAGVYLANIDPAVTEPVFTADLLRETILDEETGYLSHPSVVTGPYIMTSWDGETAEFEINEYFKGKYYEENQKVITVNEDGEEVEEDALDANGEPIIIQTFVTPTVKSLTVKTASYDTMLDELVEGNFDLLNKVTSNDVVIDATRLMSEHVDEEGNSEYQVSFYPRVGLGYIGFACEKEELSDEAVRHAIAWCMNRDEVLDDYLGRNLALRVDGYYGIGQWMYLLLNNPERLAQPAEGASAAEIAEYERTLEGLMELAKIDRNAVAAPAAPTPAQAPAEEEENTSPLPEVASAWEEDLTAYTLDLEQAAALLEGAGWKLNKDGVREKTVQVTGENGETTEKTMTLDLSMIYPEGTTLGETFEEYFLPNLEKVGIKVSLEALPLSEVAAQFHDPQSRQADLIFLATNLELIFDPAVLFTTVTDEATGAVSHIWTSTGMPEEVLYQEALAMRETEPGDVLTYCQHWVAFQKEFNRVLPMIPLYSNVYADVYSGHLHDYAITENATWSDAIITASLQEELVGAEEETEAEEESEEELEEGEVIFGD